MLDNTVPGASKEKKEDAGSDDDDDEKVNEIIDLPPSWVSNINITLEQFESKCPTGGKTI